MNLLTVSMNVTCEQVVANFALLRLTRHDEEDAAAAAIIIIIICMAKQVQDRLHGIMQS